jgi:hypothetical protein
MLQLYTVHNEIFHVSSDFGNHTRRMSYEHRPVSIVAMLDGYGEILETLHPYICIDPHQITVQPDRAIKRLAQQFSIPPPAELAASTA